MKKGKGKNKGSSFEREISRAIDKWWKVPSGTFWRTTNSGGWKEPGDIAPRLRQHQEKVWWPFVVECKFYKQIPFWSLFSKNNQNHLLIKWWTQVTKSQKDAIDQGRDENEAVRLLIFKQNNSPVFVLVGFEDMPEDFFCFPPAPVCIADVLDEVVLLFPWDAFTKLYTKENIYEWFGKKETAG